MNKIFIFILCPPFQGSTILYKLISSSPHATSLINNGNGNGEGQWLLEKDGYKIYKNRRWNKDFTLNMKRVKNCYDKYWNHTKKIYVEKSPPNILRAKQYENYFSKFGKVYFVVSIKKSIFY